jgi:hypothetical protein
MPSPAPTRKTNQITYSKYQSMQDNIVAVSNLEQKLMVLHLEKEKKVGEFGKMPEVCKTVASKRRRDELELEISILDTNIASLKSKLRTYVVS